MFSSFTNFKEKISQCLDKYSDLKERVKEEILAQAKTNLKGYQKKEIVDGLLIKGLNLLIAQYNNKILTIILQYFISKVPTTTQRIYDELKNKIEEL